MSGAAAEATAKLDPQTAARLHAPERWPELCGLLADLAPRLEFVGAFSADGDILALSAAGAAPLQQPPLDTLWALAERLGGPSPLGGKPNQGLQRAMVTTGRRKLLVRALSSSRGYVFACGESEGFTTDAWLLLDAVAVLGGALEIRRTLSSQEEKR
ncbi:MAG: hypothetical protein AAF725_12225 [Acidobacteriota bacterium]